MTARFNLRQLVLVFLLTVGTEATFAQLSEVKSKGALKRSGSHMAVSRSQSVDADFSEVKKPMKDAKGKKLSLKMSLFSDLNVEANLELKQVVHDARGTYIGQLKDSKSEIIVSRNNDAVVVDFEHAGKHYQIRPSNEGGYVVEESDVSRFPNMENDTISATSNSVTTSTSTISADANTVDMLVVFTSNSASALGGTDAATAFADSSVASFNTAASNSAVGTRLRLVGVVIGSTPSSGSLMTDLNRLTASSDGFFDEALQAREYFGADLVSIISESIDNCGLGYNPGQFTAVNRGCAIGNRSFAHEVGHNFGCRHDAQTEGGAVSYNYGYRFFGLDNVEYRTIMAYAPGARIGHFSNPNINYQGVPTGTTAAANNARKIIEATPNTAAYRAEKIVNTTPSLTFSPSVLDYGTVGTGTTKVLSLTLTNSGGQAIRVTNLSIVGADFTSSDLAACIRSYNAFETCKVNVSFSSLTAGAFNSALQVLAEGVSNTSSTVVLKASAVAPTPNVVVPSTLTFAKINAGTTSLLNYRVSNSGTANLIISKVSLVSNTAGIFSVASGTCDAKTLAPGAYCDLSIKFAPLAGGTFTGSISVDSNDPDTAKATTSISGIGATPKGKGGRPR